MTVEELIAETGISASLAERVIFLMDNSDLSSLEESEGSVEHDGLPCGEGCCFNPAWKIIGPRGYVILPKY